MSTGDRYPHWTSAFSDQPTVGRKGTLHFSQISYILTACTLNSGVRTTPIKLFVVHCSDHKRHDNFIDIGICPETSIKPRKLQLADMDDTVEGGVISVSLAAELFWFLCQLFDSILHSQHMYIVMCNGIRTPHSDILAVRI